MSITVGLPTYNEETSILNCLDSCLNQTRLPDEIIVVASGCTDGTVPKIQEYQINHPIVKLIIEKERQGKISAINKILKEAQGDLIVHTDGDVVLKDNSIEKLALYLEKYSFVSAVTGRGEVASNKSILFDEWARKTADILNEDKLVDFRNGKLFHICGYVFAHRKGSIKEVPYVKGATDATMGSILKEKGIIVLDTSIRAIVKYPNNIRDFIRQKARIRYGFLSLNRTLPSNRNFFSELKFLKKLFSGNSLLINLGFLYIGIIYFACWLKAYLWFVRDADLDEIWQSVISTK